MKRKCISMFLVTAMVTSLFSVGFADTGQVVRVVDEETSVPTFIGGIGEETRSLPLDKALESPASSEMTIEKSIDFETPAESSPLKTPETGVAGFYNQNQDLFLVKEKSNDYFDTNFKVNTEFQDDLGNKVVRTQQTIKGIPVYGYQQSVTVDKNGKTKSYSGNVVPGIDALQQTFDTSTQVSVTQAIEIAEKDLAFKPLYDYDPSATLMVYMNNGEPVLVYEVTLAFMSPEPGYWSYFVNAKSGEVVDKLNKIAHGTATTAQGTGVNGDLVNLNTYRVDDMWGTSYALFDATRGNGILIYDAANGSRLPGSIWWDSDNRFHSSYDAAAVDALSHAAQVYDYFNDVHGRKSFDNNNTRIKSTVHYGQDYANAFWNGQQMVYGDGDNSEYLALSAALDVVAHELTHAVTERTANLIYKNESGAINEAVSDIFGTLTEIHHNDKPDWFLGEDIAGPNNAAGMMRNMKDPGRISLPATFGSKYPEHYSERYTGTLDNGGVHINSSIINKWAYLVSEGGNHTGITVNGIGHEKLGKITYRALTVHMTQSTDFSDLRGIMIYTARELYGNGAEVTAVTNAFNAVGIQ